MSERFNGLREMARSMSNEELKEEYRKINTADEYDFVAACAIEAIAVSRGMGGEL